MSSQRINIQARQLLQEKEMIPVGAQQGMANVDQVPEKERRSPKGRYHMFRKQLFTVLGDDLNRGPWTGVPPFDVELARIPPGATNFPKHSHTTQWEFFIILSGQGTMVRGDEQFSIGPGDFFMQEPETAHHLINTGGEDLVYYIIANNPVADISHYPDSDKWYIMPQGICFRLSPADYYDGEE